MSSITDDLKRELLDRDEYKCLNCNSEEFLECAHFIAVSQNGTDTLNNLMTLCRTCHRKQHDGKLRIVRIVNKFFFKETV